GLPQRARFGPGCRAPPRFARVAGAGAERPRRRPVYGLPHGATALKHFSACVELCDAAGLARIAVPNRAMMGHCRIYVCDFDAALDDMQQALKTARRIGNSHAEMFALQSTGLCLTAAGRHDETAEIQAEALEQARRLKARRYEAIILALCAERALVAGRAAEALSLVRSGLEASDETSPGFAGPILFGLLALAEPSSPAQEAALSAGESLLAKGAVGHNHFPAYPPSSASFSIVYGIGTVRTPAQVRRGIMAARSYLRLKRYWYSAR